MVFLCVASVVVFILYLAESEALDVLVSMYMSYFYGLVGIESGDNSADSRILQLAIVTAFFLENPGSVFHGAGFLTVDG